MLLVIVYLILGKIFRMMWPNSQINKFFGGSMPPEDVIAEELKEIYRNPNPNANNHDPDDANIYDIRLDTYF